MLPLTNKSNEVAAPVHLEDVLAKQKAAPLSYDDFKNFLKKELADENLEFYEKVNEFKSEKDNDAESVNSADELAKQLTEQYVKPSAEKQVNLEGQMRDKIIDTVESSPTVPVNVFDDAQAEVKALMQSGAFYRFVKNAVTKNITQEQGDWRKRIGVLLGISGLVITLLAFVLQIVLPGTALDSRWWRLASLPFYIGAYSYYVSGSKCLCSGLAAKGVYMRPGEKRTWRDIFNQKNKDENKIIDDFASRKLRWEGRKLTIKAFTYGTLFTAVIVLLPPGSDLYPGL